MHRLYAGVYRRRWIEGGGKEGRVVEGEREDGERRRVEGWEICGAWEGARQREEGVGGGRERGLFAG